MAVIFAHRGFSHKYPENTMLSFRKAIELGCCAIELDVQLSADGEVVVIHDETLDRTTGVPGLVKDKTLSELRRINACGKYSEVYGFEPVPTLAEYFDLIKDKDILTSIELKTREFTYPGRAEKTIALINEYGLADRVWFSSFNHFSILECKKMAPHIIGGLVISCWMVDAAEYTYKLGADTLNTRYSFMSKELIDELHSFGKKALAWTPDEPKEIERLLNDGVDAIITNRPDLALEVVRRRG